MELKKIKRSTFLLMTIVFLYLSYFIKKDIEFIYSFSFFRDYDFYFKLIISMIPGLFFIYSVKERK